MMEHRYWLNRARRRHVLSMAVLSSAMAVLSGTYILGSEGERFAYILSVGALVFLALVISGLSFALSRKATKRLDVALTALDRRINLDELSGALSRQRFLDILNGRLDDIRAAQFGGQPAADFTLLLLDVDHFKKINDNHGHAAGDEVIKAVARHASFRSEWTIGRLGGDEFAVIVNGTDHRQVADDIEQYRGSLNRDLRSSEATRSFEGVSIGIASAPADATCSRELLNKADIALYHGKRTGRGKFTFYNAEMERQRSEDRQIARDLHAAMLMNELEVFYQPITADDPGDVTYAEALLRWKHPLIGHIPPDRFIRVAEQTDLIVRLGEWVIARACQDLERHGFETISINVSGRQLRQPSFATSILGVLEKYRVEPSSIVLEITETVILNASQEVLNTVRELRAAGFRIALDDFGTGNNSFALLRELPIDVIKIDRSYIQRQQSDTISRVFVCAVAEIARQNGLIVIAEGIETDEHLLLTKAAGIARFQGYYFGRPQPLHRDVASKWRRGSQLTTHHSP